jgi:glutathione S-transferase
MFFEQYTMSRAWPWRASSVAGRPPIRRAAPNCRGCERAATALAVMEQHLRQAQWFTGSEYGIADIALFAYTDVADEGDQPGAVPRRCAWLQRVRGQPRFLPMPAVTPSARTLRRRVSATG